jgi:hypothetical protein
MAMQRLVPGLSTGSSGANRRAATFMGAALRQLYGGSHHSIVTSWLLATH